MKITYFTAVVWLLSNKYVYRYVPTARTHIRNTCGCAAHGFKSNQIKFINIRQQIIKSTHVKKKRNEQCKDIKDGINGSDTSSH